MSKTIEIMKEGPDRDIVGFNYATVPADVREQMRTDARAIRSSLMSAAVSFMEVGERLARWRDELPHGAWLPWVQTEIGMSEQSARDAINVHLRFRDNPMFFKDLNLALPQTALVRLATAPDAAFEDVRDRLERGERLRVSDVSQIVKRHREIGQEESLDSKTPRKPTTERLSASEELQSMSDKALNELIPLFVERLAQLLQIIERAGTEKPSKKNLEKQMRIRAQWLSDALEQIAQRRAQSATEFVHVTFLDRPPFEAGPWADVAAFLRDIAHSLAWERIKASDVPDLLRRGREALQTALA